MTPKLTSEQREALEQGAGPIRVVDDERQRVYFLVDEATFKSLQQREDLIAIREGIADLEAGRLVTLQELDARIRARCANPANR